MHSAMVPKQSETAKRLRARMDEIGVTQDQLAEALGATQGTISLILTGKTQRSRLLPDIAEKLGVELSWLRGEGMASDIAEAGMDGSTISATGLRERPHSNLVLIREIDLSFGMGTTYLDVPVTTQIREFNRDWLRQYTSANPDQMFFAQGIGDSMAPTLMNSDLLLIDASKQSLTMADYIWAFSIHGAGMIKRLRPWKNGVKLLSDNPSVPEEMAYDGELHLIGRVVAIVRKI